MPTMTFNSPARSRRAVLALVTASVLATSGIAYAAIANQPHAGPQGDGTALTPTGWHVTPAGQQLTLGERPYGMALSPDGRHALVSNDGVGTQSVQLVDVANGKVSSQIDYVAPEAVFLGVAWSSDGRRAYVSGGQNDKIRVYDVNGSTLMERTPLKLATAGTAAPSFAAGLALSADDSTLYVADHLDNTLSVLDVASGTETRIALTGRTCAFNDFGSDPSNGRACEFAYGVALSPGGQNAFVSSWGKDYVTRVDTRSLKVTGRIRTGTHPSALLVNPHRNELYVANSDNDSVAVLDATKGTLRRTISLSPYPGARPGTQPNALSISPDGGVLYVANAGNNDVDVIRLGSRPGTDRVAGLIPTGWYPTAVAATPDGKRIVVANGKGLGAGPNPGGPVPGTSPESPPDQYIGSMIKGTMSVIRTPNAAQLARYTAQVQRNGGFPDLSHAATQHVVPLTATGTARGPIKHVIYIVNENRTYDQVLGDLGKGNGDPDITLFGQGVTPNHHALASDFVTLDNLYAAGEVSEDGWEWSTAANASTLDVKTQPTNYGGRGHFYVGEGGTLGAAPGVVPSNSYIWDRIGATGQSYRNYGFWATDTPPVEVYNEPNLDAHTDHAYPGFNMKISDQTRYAEWLKEFNQYEKSGQLPAMEFLKFPRDHTSGTTPGAPTPKAMVADSDLAIGKLVQTVSHSKFWKNTAIFVIEDDAQDGPDHVDAHRTLAHVISPYTQTGKVDSTFYSTESMLRTIELILGVKPLTQFDAAATPMYASFTDQPDFGPYRALTPDQSLTETNPATAPLAAQSAAMNFTKEDQAPPQLLNQAIWQSVKGMTVPMPAPRSGLWSGS